MFIGYVVFVTLNHSTCKFAQRPIHNRRQMERNKARWSYNTDFLEKISCSGIFAIRVHQHYKFVITPITLFG